MKIYDFIIILSSPRSGSTFLYQILLKKFKLCYFSNSDEKKYITYNSPIKYSTSKPRNISLDNQFGKTRKTTDPTEGSLYFKFWFEKEISENKIMKLKNFNNFKNSINHIIKNCEYPFILKNSWIIPRLGIFEKQTSKILYIWLKRDLLDTCYSELISRYVTKKIPTEPISFDPNLNKIKMKNKNSIERQIIDYQLSYHDLIKKKLYRRNSILLNYEKLKESPNNELKKVAKKINQKQVKISINNKNDLTYTESFEHDLFFFVRKEKLKNFIRKK